jgi:hypothetical protein
MNTRVPLLAATFAALLAAAPAGAQYRNNLPAVVTPPPSPAIYKPNVRGNFASAYQQAGRPRIAVFWNRELTDDVNSRYEDYQHSVRTTEEHQSGSSDSTTAEVGSTSMSNSDRLQRETSDRASGSRLIAATGTRAASAESVTWRLESSFYNPFLGLGVRFIDRNMAMRALHGGKAGITNPDLIALETGALLGKADLLMEVLVSPDADSPIGCRFRVTVKDIDTGQVIGLLSTRAIPQVDSHTGYVAGAGGFQKVTTRTTPNLEDFAERLAEETMAQLMRTWNHGV